MAKAIFRIEQSDLSIFQKSLKANNVLHLYRFLGGEVISSHFSNVSKIRESIHDVNLTTKRQRQIHSINQNIEDA